MFKDEIEVKIEKLKKVIEGVEKEIKAQRKLLSPRYDDDILRNAKFKVLEKITKRNVRLWVRLMDSRFKLEKKLKKLTCSRLG